MKIGLAKVVVFCVSNIYVSERSLVWGEACNNHCAILVYLVLLVPFYFVFISFARFDLKHLVGTASWALQQHKPLETKLLHMIFRKEKVPVKMQG